MIVKNYINPELDITEHLLPIDITDVFANKNDLALEIGFGDGDFLIEIAKRKTNWNFVGIEIKRKRYKKTIKKAKKSDINNVKLLHMDATIAVDEVFPPNAFSTVYINFPDPWPKDRHMKNRLISNIFLEKLSKVMKPNASLEIASDHKNYIDQILTVFKETSFLKCVYPPPGYTKSLVNRPITKYENVYRAEGRDIYYLRFLNENTCR